MPRNSCHAVMIFIYLFFFLHKWRENSNRLIHSVLRLPCRRLLWRPVFVPISDVGRACPCPVLPARPPKIQCPRRPLPEKFQRANARSARCPLLNARAARGQNRASDSNNIFLNSLLFHTQFLFVEGIGSVWYLITSFSHSSLHCMAVCRPADCKFLFIIDAFLIWPFHFLAMPCSHHAMNCYQHTIQ